MDINIIIIVVVAWGTITLLYKITPPRTLGPSKPAFSLLPKYKTTVALPRTIIDSSDPDSELKNRLGEFGFVEKSSGSGEAKFVRGHLLGDFSIELTKIVIEISRPRDDKRVLSLEAGWLVLFDTGDFWTFLTELKKRIETES